MRGRLDVRSKAAQLAPWTLCVGGAPENCLIPTNVLLRIAFSIDLPYCRSAQLATILNLHSGGAMQISVSGELSAEGGGRLFLLTPCEVLSSIRLVVGGHSHAAPIARALVSNAIQVDVGTSRDFALSHGIAGLRGGPVSLEYLDLLVTLASERGVAVVWNGNQYNADFLLASHPHIDFVPRSYPDKSVLPGARVLPETMIRQHFASSLEQLRLLLPRIPLLDRLPRLLVGTPPPLYDSDLILQRIVKEPAFGNKARALGMDLSSIAITPPSVRRKLWFTLQALMSEIASGAGWRFVPVPDDVFDAHGFLRPELSAGDVTHANLQFGGIMLREMVAQAT